MSEYLGDFAQGNVVYIEKCTTDSTGLPSAMTSGSACVKRMSDQVLGPGCTAITTSGGLFSLSVTTGSSATFYVKGDYSVYLGAGTAGGVIIIGYPLGQFSIGRFAALTLSTNVLQWNGTTPNNLISGRVDANANAAIATATVSANVLQVQGSTINPLISGRVDANAAAVTTSANLLTWLGSTPNALIAGRVDANANAAIATVTVSANVLAINSVSTSAVTTVKAVQGLTTADIVTTVSGNVSGNVVGSVGSVAGAVGSVTGNVGGNVVGSVASVTAGVTVTANNDKTGYALTAAGNNAAADAFLLRDIATGASVTDRNVQNTLRAIRNKTLITTTGQLIVFQEDDTATAWTAVTTTTTAQSIASIDPA